MSLTLSRRCVLHRIGVTPSGFVGVLTCKQQSPFLDGATRYLCLQNLIIRRYNYDNFSADRATKITLHGTDLGTIGSS
ncbi:hypothetical protein M405DRAFT_812196, partial [Rhizopogon salebrosus TDB-379]